MHEKNSDIIAILLTSMSCMVMGCCCSCCVRMARIVILSGSLGVGRMMIGMRGDSMRMMLVFWYGL